MNRDTNLKGASPGSRASKRTVAEFDRGGHKEGVVDERLPMGEKVRG
jgi:hypothetical protein